MSDPTGKTALYQILRTLAQGSVVEPAAGLSGIAALPQGTNKAAKVVGNVRENMYSPVTDPTAQFVFSKVNDVLTSPARAMPDTPAGQTIGENILPMTLAVYGGVKTLKATPKSPGLPKAAGPAAKQRGVVIPVEMATPEERSTLPLAQKMHSAGVGNDVVASQTGWWKDHLGQWVTELDDSKARLKMPIKDLPDSDSGQAVSLPDVLDHPELMWRDSQIREAVVQKLPSTETHLGDILPGDESTTTLMRVKPTTPIEDTRTALHETQHLLQSLRGIDVLKETTVPYRKQPLEVEARVVEQRAGWSPEMRKALPFPEHVAREIKRVQESLSTRLDSIDKNKLKHSLEQRGIPSKDANRVLYRKEDPNELSR